MNREVLINIINRGGIRFIPVRRCPLCDEYVGYKFVRMCDGSMIPVFSSGCRCCGGPRGRPWTDRAGLYPSPCPLVWRTVLKLSSTRKRSIKEL